VSRDYDVIIRAKVAADDGLDLDMGAIVGAWWDVPLPPCPDCPGGVLVHHEAGHAPGTRRCRSCCSLFEVHTVNDRACLRRARFYNR
jgi:hypothetical protein